MFSKVLVANRGEVALRIIRTLRDMGIKSVAVFSEADRGALHVKFADEAVCIGPGPATDSYLKIPSIISAAEITRSEAVHPGYGFLSENPRFAELCEKCGLTWLGPEPETMRKLGDKLEAREVAKDAGVPILEGSPHIKKLSQLKDEVARIGLPIILKASGGGGGRGMKIIRKTAELENSWQTAKREAEQAFKDSSLYVERFCEQVRHIEIQVIGDGQGKVISLGTRDCSSQRRHQKVVEEGPAAMVETSRLLEIERAAERLCGQLSYQGLGTVEFLVTESDYFFIEVNPRLQVEHTVTEETTGLDLVRCQLEVASGGALPERIEPVGHAIQIRVNAEDSRTFKPSPGLVEAVNLPGGPGVRVDTHIYAGYMVPPFYDALLAKVIVSGSDRVEAVSRLRRVLHECVIVGPASNIDFLRRFVATNAFSRGQVFTHSISEFLTQG